MAHLFLVLVLCNLLTVYQGEDVPFLSFLSIVTNALVRQKTLSEIVFHSRRRKKYCTCEK